MIQCSKMKAHFDVALSAVQGGEAEVWRRMAILQPEDIANTKFWVEARRCMGYFK